MKLSNISLPYPVLGINDDILPLLPEDAVTVNIEQDLREYTFFIRLKYDNKKIRTLIEQGFAEYSCDYQCSKTMLRVCVKSTEPEFIIRIPRQNINGRINFSCFISVKKSIYDYINDGFNEDYDGFTFDMEPGDVLAAFPDFYYDVDIKYDKLQAAGSFMQIGESELYEEVYFDISSDKIMILLPPKLYQLYKETSVSNAAVIIHSSLVLNALTYALINIEDHSQTTWGRTIKYRLANEKEYNLSDLGDMSKIPGLAQRLLKDPYLRLFNHLIESNEGLNSEEEL